MDRKLVTKFVICVSAAAAITAAIGFAQWNWEGKRANHDLSVGAVPPIEERIHLGPEDAIAPGRLPIKEASPSSTQRLTVYQAESEDTIKTIRAEIRELLMGELDSAEFRMAFEALAYRLRIAHIDRSRKQRLLWDLAVESTDANARMRIYDLLERNGTEFVARSIIEHFDNIQSPDERSRLLLLLSRSLEPIYTEADARLWQQRVSKNSGALSDLLLRQISSGDWTSSVFREAIELLPEMVSANHVIETYNVLRARQMISDSAYFIGMAQAILSNESNFNTFGIDFLRQLSNQDASIKDTVNSILFPYVAATQLDPQRLNALREYIESYKPQQFRQGIDNYDEWAGSYVDWISARSATRVGDGLSVISSRVSPLERALLVRNRPDLLMALDPTSLSQLSASLHSALGGLTVESPHREMVRATITRVEAQLRFSSGN